MSASVSQVPNLAAIAGNLLLSGGESETANLSAGEPDQFAAYFQLLLGRQLAIETAVDSLPEAPIASAGDEDSADELAALLPFIEALGMTQAAATLPVEAHQASVADSTTPLPDGTTAIPAAVLPTFLPTDTTSPAGNAAAPPALAIPRASSAATTSSGAAAVALTTTPAMSPSSTAASPATRSAGLAATMAAALASSNPSPVTTPGQEASTAMADLLSVTAATANAPAISAANASPQGQTNGFAFNLPAQLSPPETSLAPLPAATPGNGATADALSAGREFSSQLVATIAASKEAQHSSGTTAEAVQNIISQAAPGRAGAHESAPVISQAVGAPGWSEEVGNRVAWMAGHAESKAELVLNPPQMGRIEVNLTLKGDQATASFASSNPVVREALEAALPRLREVLADAGIQLGQTQVNAENARQWTQQEKNGDNSTSDPGRGNAADPAISHISSGSLSTTAALKTGRGFVDVFA
jgi:flagellar hook-length control protein FliK